jgi:DNA-directed RNA polymerase specialized sigma subunit
MTVNKKRDSSNFIDKDLYETNLPAFQAGEKAKQVLSSSKADRLSRSDKAALKKAVRDGDAAFAVIYTRVEWLVKRIVKEEMAKPRAFHVILEEEDLEQAALEGVYKMLKKADLDKMESALNYLMNWIKTTVERAASKNESEFGMPPSRLRIFKKIAAVRAKVRNELGRQPTNEEVLEYFHSGKADWKSKYGKKGSNGSAFKENANMSLKNIEEQEYFDVGHPMHTAVTDELSIDREASSNGGVQDVLNPESKHFWITYMDGLGIPEHQQESIAWFLGLYDTNGKGKPNKNDKKDAEQLSNEFKSVIACSPARLQEYAVVYEEQYGEGPWSAFKNIPVVDRELPTLSVLTIRLEGGK